MISLLNGFAAFNMLWLLGALVALALMALEGERAWTRIRRSRQLQPGTIAYLLDGLALTCAILLMLAVALLLTHTVTSVLALMSSLFGFDGSQPSISPSLLVALIVVGMLVLLGVARARRGDGERQAASSNGAPLPALSSGGSLGALSASTPIAAGFGRADRPMLSELPPQDTYSEAAVDTRYRPARTTYTPQPLAEDEELPALTMMQERRKPAPVPVPQSFLNLDEPAAAASAASAQRRMLAPTLAMLTVLVLLIGGAVLFRQQVIGLLSRMDIAGAVGATSQPAASVQSPPPANPTSAAVNSTPPQAPVKVEQLRHVISDTLNVRKQPGVNQDVIVVLLRGDPVTQLEESQEIEGTTWVKVHVGNKEGWVSRTFLE